MSVSLWLKGGVKLPADFDTRKQWVIIPMMKGDKPILSKKTGKPRVIRVRFDELQRKMLKRAQSAGVTHHGNKPHAGQIMRPAEVWRPEYATLIEHLALARFDVKRIAETMGVRISWLEAQLETNQSAIRAYRKGTALAAGEVANALKKRATGYDYPEEKIFCYEGDIVRAKTKRHYPAETGAAIAFLQQHSPGNWNTKNTTELTGPGGGPIQTQNLHAIIENAQTARDAADAYAKLLENAPEK